MNRIATVAVTVPGTLRFKLSDVLNLKTRIDTKLADAAAALRAADDKLGMATDEFNGSDCCCDNLDLADLRAARLNARVFADAIETDESTALPQRVFRSLRNHANGQPDNAPHVEGAILALQLAADSLHSALELAAQFNGDEIGVRYEVAYAGYWTIVGYARFLAASSLAFDQEAARETLVGRKRTLARSA